MDIKCWGSRGSISVSGKSTVKYGGDTTCLEITAKSGQTIIVDAGTGLRRLGNSFIRRNITDYYMVFTHAHWDHVLGFAFFRPLQYSKTNIIIQDRTFAGFSTKQVLGGVMKAPFFPIGLDDLKANITFDKQLNDKFTIGSISIEAILTSHPGGGLGYKFIEDGKSFVFLTDNELGFDHPGGMGFEAYQNFCSGVDLLFHDGEYTADEYERKSSWGHSSITQVMDLAVKAKVKKLGLLHLSQDRTDDQMDQIVAECKADLRKINSTMDCFAVSCDLHLKL